MFQGLSGETFQLPDGALGGDMTHSQSGRASIDGPDMAGNPALHGEFDSLDSGRHLLGCHARPLA